MPTDLGDANVWGPILDTALGTVVDRHDHTTGKGVKIPSAALKINADVSWSDAGASRAITDLKAVDFTPSAVQTALAGALFVSDGTSSLTANELYWRTTSGVNVKVTAGSALNVAAFTGGIGGDYTAVGALALFDDATDSYWFQQQVGASVRQYARMRSADVDLYEFKAHPDPSVPTNRVRLASPAALAASYTVTMPAALSSAARALLEVTSAGVARLRSTGTLINGVAGVPISGTVTPSASAAGGLLFCSPSSNFAVSLPMSENATFSAWTIYMSKASNATRTITAQLYQQNMLTFVVAPIGAAQTTSANAPGPVVLAGAGTPNVADCSFYILVSVGANDAVSDRYLGCRVIE